MSTLLLVLAVTLFLAAGIASAWKAAELIRTGGLWPAVLALFMLGFGLIISGFLILSSFAKAND